MERMKHCSTCLLLRRCAFRYPTPHSPTCRTSASVQPKERRVLVSTSNNVFSNLALEDWLYRHRDFSSQCLLFLWRNHPCVVIGRHQNPWMECSLPSIRRKNVALARRKSGGGTVYHDLGNLNCTFFTDRKGYDRAANLSLVVRALRETWPLEVAVGDRDDIVLDGKYKVSGTAAALSRHAAYHHCTLLFDANTSALRQLLQPSLTGVRSRATESIRSPVQNLCDRAPSLNYTCLVNALSYHYLHTNGTDATKTAPRPIEWVDPTSEITFPGLLDIEMELKSWKWIYEKTPKFTITKSFPSSYVHGLGVLDFSMNFEIEKGHVTVVKLSLSPSMYQSELEELAAVIVGQRLCQTELNVAMTTHMKCSSSLNKLWKRDVLPFVANCIENVFIDPD